MVNGLAEETEIKGVLTDWEGALGQVQSNPQAPNLIRHNFVRLCLPLCHGLIVRLIDEMLPGRFDISGAAEVSGLEDDKADVEVAGLVSIFVVELKTLHQSISD